MSGPTVYGKVTSASEVISDRAQVIESGGVVRVWIPNDRGTFDSYGRMLVEEKRSMGRSIRYFGRTDRDSNPVTWVVHPFRNCADCG